MPVASKMLLQLAVRDIGQLTDIERFPAAICGYAGRRTVLTQEARRVPWLYSTVTRCGFRAVYAFS
jgi:hypothetical protein